MVLRFMGSGTLNMLLFFGAFIRCGMVAEEWSRNQSSMGMQYLGLTTYTLVEALFFAPILLIASQYGGEGTIASAGIAVSFSGLTAR